MFNPLVDNLSDLTDQQVEEKVVNEEKEVVC
jgi:hypothetical protein